MAIELQLGPGTPLISSITHNLPRLATGEGPPVYCYLSEEAVVAVVCQEIGKLDSTSSYVIGIKVNFASSVTALGDFGSLRGFLWKEELQGYDFENAFIETAVAAELAAVVL